jgi:hypothetical protein
MLVHVMLVFLLKIIVLILQTVALWDLRNLKLKLHSFESHKDEIFQVRVTSKYWIEMYSETQLMEFLKIFWFNYKVCCLDKEQKGILHSEYRKFPSALFQFDISLHRTVMFIYCRYKSTVWSSLSGIKGYIINYALYYIMIHCCISLTRFRLKYCG